MVMLPLAVMLLLTLLIGVSSYRLTQHWTTAIGQLSGEVAETVILNNIRWELVQVSQNRETNPQRAEKSWQEAKKYLTLMTPERRPAVLENLFANKANMANVENWLGQDVFRINLDRLQRGLKDAQDYAYDVNLMMTASMLVLGFILMPITTRDLNRFLVQLRQSRDLNVTIQEEERRRLAQDLHDGVIQELVDLKRSYTPQKVDEMVETIRRVCHNLKPQVLDDLGLAAAIDFLSDDLKRCGVTQVDIHIDREELGRLPKRYELPIFRVIQELFSNVKQHAHASEVSLTMVYHPDESPMLRVYAYDNGVGFDPENIVHKGAQPGLGLTGIQERIQQLDGRITIESDKDKGSRFQISVPVKS